MSLYQKRQSLVWGPAMATAEQNMGVHPALCKSFSKLGNTANLAKQVERPAFMSQYEDLSMKSEDVLRVELEEFKRQHRDLDEAITALEEKPTSERLTIKRLKQQKLRLKDRISWIQDRLTPDIIA